MSQVLKQFQTNSITGETLTFSHVDEMSRKVASWLMKRGIKPGDKCIYLTFDVTRMFAIAIGIWRAGGVVCTSYAEDTQGYPFIIVNLSQLSSLWIETLADRVKDYKAKWLFCDPSGVSLCQFAVKQASWPVDIVSFGDVEGTIHVDTIFEDDGSS